MSKTLSDPRYICIIAQLKKARIAEKLSQAELSLRLGKPQSFVSKYETNERRLDIVELILICAALHISISEVLPTEFKKFV